ncbi:hypothetical protein G9A89_017835 [Geosiphon pyriformis]|nr:hypothetical protein G9A89_017835 [Geosiphon pyriformis]
MSGPSAKKRSARVLTTVKKPLHDVELSSADKNLKDDRPVSVDGQFTSMDTNGEAFDGRATSDSQMNMPNAKRFNTSAAISSSFGSINYNMDDKEEVFLLSRLFFSLEKMWVDPKIVKSQVEVTVKKLFALDINLSAVKGKSVTAKTQVIKKLFSTINGFGGATTLSKFEEIIRSIFILSESMEKAASLARENNIIVNSNFKRQGICSDRAIVIKKIFMNMLKEMIVATVSEFGEIKLIKIQLIGLWQKAVVEFAELEQAVSLAARWFFLIGKDSVRVTMAVGDREAWASRDQFRALLFTLPVGTTAHNLGDLLEKTGGKTCVINQSLETGNRVRCVVVCFDSDEILESLGWIWFTVNGVRSSVILSWNVMLRLYQLLNFKVFYKACQSYTKKNVPISRPVAFGGKSWAQMVSVASVFHGFCAGSGSSFPPSGALSSGGAPSPLPVVNSPLGAHLVLLEHSVELLSNQVSDILSHLDNIGSAPLASFSQMVSFVVVSQSPIFVPLVVANSNLDFDMAPTSFSPGVVNLLLDLSSSKVLTSKVGSLKSKLVALDISVGSILAKLDQLCAGSGSSEDIFHWHKESGSSISIVTETKLCSSSQPWIIKKFEGVQVFTSGLNVGFCGAGVAIFVNNSLAHYVFKVEEMKGRVLLICLLFKNKLSVSVIGLYVCVSGGNHFVQASVINSFIADTVNKSFFVVLGGDFNENNSVKGVSLRKCLGLGLVNVFGGHSLARVSTWSNSKDISKVLNYILVNNSLISAVVDYDVSSVSEFFDSDHLAVSMSIGLGGLLNAYLNSICKHANKDHWKFKIKDADEKKWVHFKELSECALLGFLDRFKTAEDSGNLNGMWGVLAEAMTASAEQNFSKHWYSEFDCATNILSSKFSKLELLVAKLLKVLRLDDTLGFNHLVDIWFKADSSEASKVHGMVRNGVSSVGLISHLSKVKKQYRKSKYYESEVAKRSAIRDAIDKHMKKFDMDKIKLKVDNIMMSLVIRDLPDGKASGLFGIINELWKHAGCLVLECLLSLLNFCLQFGNVPDGVLSNTQPIALIETARKILSKVLSDKISLACIKVMTDFGLSDGYKVLDGLNQGEVFSPFFWRIFYNPLLCEVAKQDHLCGYRINSNFVAKTRRIETSGSMTSFFMAGAFVDDTIWVGNGQASTQHILNIAKDGCYSYQQKSGIPVLFINGQAITVASPGVSHRYLGIFLSTDGLSKPSFAKANSDIRFFSNMILWKAVFDKQFSYLVSAVLQPIAECKVASIVQFANFFGILGHLLPCAFRSSGHFPILLVLGDPLYFKVICSLKIADVAYGNQLLDKKSSVISWHMFCQWKRLGSRGSVPLWFLKASTHLNSGLRAPLPASLASVYASVLDSTSFADIREKIHGLWADEIDVYTDGSLRGLGTFQVACGAAAYFLSLNKGLGVEIHSVLSSTLAKLQTVALALECIPVSVSVALHTDSQVAIDACVAKLGLLQPDYLTVHWIKVKGHADIADNIMADVFAEQAAHSKVSLPVRINCKYVVANDRPVFGNAHHFVRDIFHSICKFQWEMGPGQEVLFCLFGLVVDWNSTALVWHPDFYMLSGSTCQVTTALHMYFIKAVHFKLLVAVRKRLYSKDYPGVVCLFCGNVELPNYGFTCVKNAFVWWETLVVSDVGLYLVFCKGFVLKSWMDEAIASLSNKKKVAFVVVDFVHHLAKSHKTNLWLFRTKFRFDMERSGLIDDDVFVASALSVGVLPFLASMVHLTSVLDSLDVGFGFRNRFLFLSGAVYRVSVSISV